MYHITFTQCICGVLTQAASPQPAAWVAHVDCWQVAILRKMGPHFLYSNFHCSKIRFLLYLVKAQITIFCIFKVFYVGEMWSKFSVKGRQGSKGIFAWWSIVWLWMLKSFCVSRAFMFLQVSLCMYITYIRITYILHMCNKFILLIWNCTVSQTSVSYHPPSPISVPKRKPPSSQSWSSLHIYACVWNVYHVSACIYAIVGLLSQLSELCMSTAAGNL